MRVALPLAALALIAAVFAFSRTADAPDGQFRFTSSGSISTLDPAGMSWIQELRIAGLLYEGLFAADPRTLRPAPACAERFDIDPTRTEYTFHLRTDARWSNGDPVTADDFIFAWRRAIEPGTAADYAFFFDEIAGVPEYVAWRWQRINAIAALPRAQRPAAVAAHLKESDRQFAQRVALRALDAHTLRLRLRRPVAYWLDILSFAVAYPLHRTTLEPFRRVGDTGLIFYDEQWAKPGRTVFNGPYVLTDWRFKRGLRLERNASYWDRARIHIGSVAYIDVADPNTAWLMFCSGRLDWLPTVDTSFAPALAETSKRRNVETSKLGTGHRALGTSIHLLPAFGTYYFNFNCRATLWDGRPNPFADPRVRRAFLLATDRDTIVKNVTRCGEASATSLVPYDVVPDYPHVAGLAYDPARAREELAAAGFPQGRDLPEIDLLYSTDGPNGLIAESLADLWRTALGVRTRLIAKEVQSFREDKKKQVFMLCSASWYGDYLDPTTFLDTLRADNGNNDSAYSDPRYGALLDDAERAADPRARLAQLASAETYLVREAAPVLPLFRYVHVVAFDPAHVRGLQLNPRLVFSLKDVEVIPRESLRADTARLATPKSLTAIP